MLLCFSVIKQSTCLEPEKLCPGLQLDRFYSKIHLQSIPLHWCVQESCGLFPSQAFLGQQVFARLEGERPSTLSQQITKSRNEADQDKYIHTPANTTSQITLMPCARPLFFQAVPLRSAPSPPFLWCDRGERVSTVAC